MRLLLPILLLAAFACAPNESASLYDGLGEVAADQVITLDQIDFNDQGVSLDSIDACLDLEDFDVGIVCDTDTASLVLNSDDWSLSPETGLAQYNVDAYPETPAQNSRNWDVPYEKKNSRWAECGCPTGCSDAECQWQETDAGGGYVCIGDCRGTHCSACTVEFHTSTETTGPAG
jgi:hypothetical protein